MHKKYIILISSLGILGFGLIAIVIQKPSLLGLQTQPSFSFVPDVQQPVSQKPLTRADLFKLPNGVTLTKEYKVPGTEVSILLPSFAKLQTDFGPEYYFRNCISNNAPDDTQNSQDKEKQCKEEGVLNGFMHASQFYIKIPGSPGSYANRIQISVSDRNSTQADKYIDRINEVSSIYKCSRVEFSPNIYGKACGGRNYDIFSVPAVSIDLISEKYIVNFTEGEDFNGPLIKEAQLFNSIVSTVKIP